jgi:hypothetical protein
VKGWKKAAKNNTQSNSCDFNRYISGGLGLRWLLGENHISFEQECPKLAHHRCASGDQAITDPVDSLRVWLIICLDRDKTHVLPLYGLRIDKVVLVGFHKRLDELGCHQPNIMALPPGRLTGFSDKELMRFAMLSCR